MKNIKIIIKWIRKKQTNKITNKTNWNTINADTSNQIPIAKQRKNKNFCHKCHKMPDTAKLVWLQNFMASTKVELCPEAFDSCRVWFSSKKTLTSRWWFNWECRWWKKSLKCLAKAKQKCSLPLSFCVCPSPRLQLVRIVSVQTIELKCCHLDWSPLSTGLITSINVLLNVLRPRQGRKRGKPGSSCCEADNKKSCAKSFLR